MAPKRQNPIEVPPAASSEEEEDEEATSSDEEEGGEGSSTEEEEGDEDPKSLSTPLTQNTAPPKKPETATPVVGNEESEESGSESESESDTATRNVKPIATKPVEENSKKPRSKPLASPVRASSSKRPGESDQDAKDAKRPKKKAGDEGSNSVSAVVEEVKKTGEDAKKQLFQRLFSEDDEIALLKGMLDYSAKKGADPVADMNAFYDFVKKSIHTDVTKAQLMDKIRRLKKKFENNAGKGKKGEDRTFSKAHEQNAFELSKRIWGKEGISGKVESSAAKSNGKAKGNNKAVIALKAEVHSSPDKKADVGVPMEVDNKNVSKYSGSLFDKRHGVASLEEEILKHGFDMLDAGKKAALEAKWRKMRIHEMEAFVERSGLVHELAKSVLESYKSEE